MRKSGQLVAVGVLLAAVPAAGVSAQTAQTEAAALPAPADTAEQVARLRNELVALRDEYGRRLADIETRLAALESRGASGAEPAPAATVPAPPPPPPETAAAAASPPPAPAAPPATAAVPPGAATEGGPTSLPVYGGGAAASKVFNPDIAAIGDFIGAFGSSHPAGFSPPSGGEPSLSMHESELSFQAVVDPYARADFFLTFGPDEVGVEEAFITFPTVPGGFLLRAGKMRDAFGKVDGQHNHVLPFIDRPLVSMNLLGGEDALADAGVSVARLIPNPWIFLEATGQVFRGESTVFHAQSRSDLAYVGHLRGYHDLTESTNLDLGGSIAYGHNDAGATVTPPTGTPGDFTTRLLGVDATLRYRPLRRSIYTHFLARAELVWSRREQPTFTADSFGAYGYLEYQFARRWFTGLRLDTSERADDPALRDRGGSFILTYWPSEFSQIRGQYRRTRYGEGRTANEGLFQFIFAIGAHGAHPF
ncbi:MAG TPA: hypothetical protein VEQ10_03275 [Vicinamibacteria bacterium]|nr:hypothetical protein [Vicinamibacteria bacterium]